MGSTFRFVHRGRTGPIAGGIATGPFEQPWRPKPTQDARSGPSMNAPNAPKGFGEDHGVLPQLWESRN